MECSTVKGLLSEYLDGMLDEKTSAGVQEHLSECADCREEYDSLEAMLRELGNMKAVTPPADFMDRLQKRLDRPSWFAGLTRALFIPMGLKIPLEFAAVALVAVIVFSIINVPPEVRVASKKPEKSQAWETAGQANVKDVSRPAKQQSPEPEAPAAARMAPALEEEAKPIELVLLIREPGPARLMAKASRAPAAGRYRHKAPSDMDLDTESGGYSAESRMAAGGKAPTEGRAPMPDTADVKQKVRDAITALGGRILPPEEVRQGGDTGSLAARIPAAQYTHLIEKLNALGTIQSPVTMPPETHAEPPPGTSSETPSESYGGGTIQLRIKVLPE